MQKFAAKTLLAVLTTLVLTGCAILPTPVSQPEVSIPEIQKHIMFLASDSLKGRGTGLPENRIAAEYIAETFAQYGLEPLGDDGYQYFDVVTDVEAGP
ncbi:MAG: hypothetical protein K9M19_03725, partial [Candidatus Marinimicrobia bacterium]|nr:hypothetical protein [Candidatus Neomarinimicrobiota bacterium]